MKNFSKIKHEPLSLDEQKENREGALIKEALCPNGKVVRCTTTTGDWEVLTAHPAGQGEIVIGIRCDNVFSYCDGHDHIEPPSSGSSGCGSGTSGTGSGSSGCGSGTSGAGSGSSGCGSGTSGCGSGTSGCASGCDSGTDSGTDSEKSGKHINLL